MGAVRRGQCLRYCGRTFEAGCSPRTHHRKWLWGRLAVVAGPAVNDAGHRLKAGGFRDLRRRRGVRLSRQGASGHVWLLNAERIFRALFCRRVRQHFHLAVGLFAQQFVVLFRELGGNFDVDRYEKVCVLGHGLLIEEPHGHVAGRLRLVEFPAVCKLNWLIQGFEVDSCT